MDRFKATTIAGAVAELGEEVKKLNNKPMYIFTGEDLFQACIESPFPCNNISMILVSHTQFRHMSRRLFTVNNIPITVSKGVCIDDDQIWVCSNCKVTAPFIWSKDLEADDLPMMGKPNEFEEVSQTCSAIFEFQNGDRIEVPKPEGNWERVLRIPYPWPHIYISGCYDEYFYLKGNLRGIEVVHKEGQLILKEYKGKLVGKDARCVEVTYWQKVFECSSDITKSESILKKLW